MSSTHIDRMSAVCLTLAAMLPACARPPSRVALTPSAPTTIFVLGSLHGFMLENSRYTLYDFLAAIEEFAPDLVLTEVRPDHAGAAEGSIDGGIEQSLVYATAAERGVSVVPIDWFDDHFIAEKSAEDKLPTPAAAARLDVEYDDAIHHASFAELQSQKTQTLVRRIYAASEAAGRTTSRTRNEKICGRLREALATHAARRVIVVFGLDHKYFLEDCAASAHARITDAADVIPDSRRIRYNPSPALEAAALANLRTSQQLLRERLARHFYSAEYTQRLAHKVADFTRWIEAVGSLRR